MEYPPVNLDVMPKKSLSYCSDGRFYNAFEISAKKLGVDQEVDLPDRIVVPGPSLWFVQNGAEAAAELEKLHNFDEMIVLDHLNCGWFKVNIPEYKNANEEKMKSIHFRYQDLARPVIEKALPNIKLQMHLVGTDHLIERDE